MDAFKIQDYSVFSSEKSDMCGKMHWHSNRGPDPLSCTVARQTDFGVTIGQCVLSARNDALFSSDTIHCPTLKSKSVRSPSTCVFCSTVAHQCLTAHLIRQKTLSDDEVKVSQIPQQLCVLFHSRTPVSDSASHQTKDTVRRRSQSLSDPIATVCFVPLSYNRV